MATTHARSYALAVTRIESRNSSLATALLKLPSFKVGEGIRVYNTTATIRQGVRKNTDDQFLKAKLAFNWTGPFKILAVGPSIALETPDVSPMAAKLLFLDLPHDRSGPHPKRRVNVARCKQCINPHDTSDMPKYMPAGLT